MAWLRSATWSLAKILERWSATVLALKASRWAIWLVAAAGGQQVQYLAFAGSQLREGVAARGGVVK